MIVNLKVRERVPYGEDMSGKMPIEIDGKSATVYYSTPKNKSVKAYIVPKDLKTFELLSKQRQKEIRHSTIEEIKNRLK